MYSLFFLCFSISILNTESTESDSRVFNGDEFRPHIHTYLVKLCISNITQESWFCSGSVINRHWIISAAHCFVTADEFIAVQYVDKIRVVARGKPSRIVIYPGFNFHDRNILLRSTRDLALLKMEKKMKFDDWLQPIPLSMQPVSIGQEVIIAGYGYTETGEAAPREGSAVVTPCSLGSGYKLICTNSVVATGGGDSGGALVSNGLLVGVPSSNTCIDGPPADGTCESYYVDVAEHFAWISGVIHSF